VSAMNLGDGGTKRGKEKEVGTWVLEIFFKDK
jgi:hypothetical protein